MCVIRTIRGVARNDVWKSFSLISTWMFFLEKLINVNDQYDERLR